MPWQPRIAIVLYAFFTRLPHARRADRAWTSIRTWRPLDAGEPGLRQSGWVGGRAHSRPDAIPVSPASPSSMPGDVRLLSGEG